MTTLHLGALRFDGEPFGADVSVKVYMHSEIVGFLTFHPEEWSSITDLASALSLSSARHEADVAELARMDVKLAEVRAENEHMRHILRRLLECYESNEIEINHPPAPGPHNDVIECPEDDTCECMGTWVVNTAAKIALNKEHSHGE